VKIVLVLHVGLYVTVQGSEVKLNVHRYFRDVQPKPRLGFVAQGWQATLTWS